MSIFHFNDPSSAGAILVSALPTGPVSRGALIGSNLLGWINGVDTGALVTSVSFAGLALVTAVIAAWEKVYQQRRAHRQQDLEDELMHLSARETATKASLTGQIADLSAELARAMEHATESTKARAEENKRHAEEVRMLLSQVAALHNTVEHQAREIMRLHRKHSNGKHPHGASSDHELSTESHGTGESERGS